MEVQRMRDGYGSKTGLFDSNRCSASVESLFNDRSQAGSFNVPVAEIFLIQNFHPLLTFPGINGERFARFSLFAEGAAGPKLQGQGKCDEWYSQSVRSVMKMDAGALVNLSSNLYEELDRQFESLQTFPRRLIDGTVGLYPETQFSKEGFILLLKCCLALLEFLEFDMSLVWEKSSVLVKILIKVCAPDFLLDANGHIAASEEPLIRTIAVILWVFARKLMI
ncbi:hypothetical protein HPP92_000179 [Vanilla planifolia]|uniref:DUF7812 domain-containing protein n=1 Tax=Vanilla planifolia TaxID=51239 RepID=A0A835VIG8_VANPL|nr:hypothetical protein HPP92_000179 [Vanilla planifolia]